MLAVWRATVDDAHDHIYCRPPSHARMKLLARPSSHHRALFEHPAAVRKFGKSGEFLSFDQTFDPTLGMIEPEWSLPMVIFFKRLIKDASGVTAIEYGLICALIVIGSLAAITSVGPALNLGRTFGTVASHL
jgi:pilus assembly protein Flp/PilA